MSRSTLDITEESPKNGAHGFAIATAQGAAYVDELWQPHSTFAVAHEHLTLADTGAASE